jgi:hypothetical protein
VCAAGVSWRAGLGRCVREGSRSRASQTALARPERRSASANAERVRKSAVQVEPRSGCDSVALKHGLVSAGAAQVRREHARGGVRELVERDVAARAGASSTQRAGVQTLGGPRTGGASNARTRVRARE